MRFAFSALLLSLSTVVIAQDSDVRGPGLIPQRQADGWSYSARNFDHVAAAMPGQVQISVGPAFAVRASGPEAAIARLRVVVENGDLKIEPRSRDEVLSEAERDLARRVRFTVALPRLAGVALAGSGKMAVDRVDGGNFAATLGGSGELALGRLAVERVKVTIGGSGVVSAAGRAGRLDVTLGGSGRLDAPGLHAEKASVMSAGSGSIRAEVAGAAAVQLVGSGSVDLGAAARCTVARQGSGAIRCGG